MVKLITKLINQANEFELCRKQWHLKDKKSDLLTITEKAIEMFEIAKSKLDTAINITRKLEIMELDKVIFNIMKEADCNHTLQSQQQENIQWECISEIEDKFLQQPKNLMVTKEKKLVDSSGVIQYRSVIIPTYIDIGQDMESSLQNNLVLQNEV